MTKRSFHNPGYLYRFLRRYVDFSTNLAYKRIKYIGKEKIPKNAGIIYAPNHTNALMDALIILAMDYKPKIFLARADIFKNPTSRKILTFLRILPIMRQRDGLDEVRKNNESIKKSVEVLVNDVPLCILPEGKHRARHSLQPLGKGIFRIAFQAQELMEEKPLYIVPVGIEYGNFFRYRSSALIQIGEPINIQDFINNHPNISLPELNNLMKDVLTQRMKDVILYIPDDDDYDAVYEICASVINLQTNKYLLQNPNEKRFSLTTRLRSNQITSTEFAELKEKHPQKAEELIAKAKEVYKLRQDAEISLSSTTMQRPFWSKLIKILILIILTPYLIPTAILLTPISLLSRYLFSKVKDRAFFNSVRLVVTLVLWPLLVIIYSAIAFIILPWEIALLIIVALIPATTINKDAHNLIRVIISDVKLALNKPLKKSLKDFRLMYFEAINSL